jgi:hypothetical protein
MPFLLHRGHDRGILLVVNNFLNTDAERLLLVVLSFLTYMSCSQEVRVSYLRMRFFRVMDARSV